MSTYRKADRRAQWFQDNYGGSRMDPNVVVVHTTESTSWPGYAGGATAPNYTARPNMKRQRLDFRAHFHDECSSRALRNQDGGVETNTLNAVQLELVGTCDPAHRHRWGSLRAGVDYIYWPEAPTWALRELARFMADQHRRHGTKLEAPSFLPYPASYGNSAVRLSGRQWRNFYGVCGHQHVPENSHGDPGDMDMDRVLCMARDMVDGAAEPAPTEDPEPAVVEPAMPTRVDNARDVVDEALRILDAAVANGRVGRVKDVRNKIRRQRNRLPAH